MKQLKNDRLIINNHYTNREKDPILYFINRIVYFSYYFAIFTFILSWFLPIIKTNLTLFIIVFFLVSILDFFAKIFIIYKRNNRISEFGKKFIVITEFSQKYIIGGLITYTTFVTAYPTSPISDPFNKFGPEALGAMGVTPRTDEHLGYIDNIKNVHPDESTNNLKKLLSRFAHNNKPDLDVIKFKIHTDDKEYHDWRGHLSKKESWSQYGLDQERGLPLRDPDTFSRLKEKKIIPKEMTHEGLLELIKNGKRKPE